MRRQMISSRATALSALILGLWAAPVLGSAWRAYADVAEAGWSPLKLAEAKQEADSIGSASVMVVHHGVVVAAWGQVDRPLPLYSMRKGLYSALVGIAVAEGKLRLDDTLAELGVDDVGGLTPAERGATVADLLASRSGIYHPAAYEPASMKRTRPERGAHAPGEHWFYNNWDFNVIATLIAGAAGQDVFAEFRERIAGPLGMEDFSAADTFSFYEPSRSQHPAPIFRLSARDLARFGLLYLQNGTWEGRALLSPAWIRESWQLRSTFPEGSLHGAGNGFGYLWWIYPQRESAEWTLPRRAAVYITRGAEGQVLAVVPALDLVLVHQSDTENGVEASFEDVTRLFAMIADACAESAPRAPTPRTVPMPVESLANPQPAPPHRQAIPWTPALIAELIGNYRLNPQVSLTVHEVAGRVFALPEGAPLAEAELFLATPQLLFSPAVDLLLEIARDPTGKAVKLSGRVEHRAATALRIDG